MKKHHLVAVALGTILLTSCSTTNFTEYHDQNIIEGKGGTVRVVEGIDFWEKGEPDRKYKILGVIDDSRHEGANFQFLKDQDIALDARKHGGDAVILTDSSREVGDVDMNGGTVRYKQISKFVVVRYVQ
jgi:hypothetical protein